MSSYVHYLKRLESIESVHKMCESRLKKLGVELVKLTELRKKMADLVSEESDTELKRLAWCMSQNPRLGFESPVAVLPLDLIHMIGREL
jgi:hypothetical protein